MTKQEKALWLSIYLQKTADKKPPVSAAHSADLAVKLYQQRVGKAPRKPHIESLSRDKAEIQRYIECLLLCAPVGMSSVADYVITLFTTVFPGGPFRDAQLKQLAKILCAKYPEFTYAECLKIIEYAHSVLG
jgi:hypothetical protein